MTASAGAARRPADDAGSRHRRPSPAWARASSQRRFSSRASTEASSCVVASSMSWLRATTRSAAELHRLEDTLPFRNLRRGAHALELVAERLRRRIARERRRAPGAAPRRQVARERVKALHRRRLARNSISCHAAALRGERLKITRLEPPAVETPGPSGPGSGAVAQSSCRSRGRRRRNSPMFQGPLT